MEPVPRSPADLRSAARALLRSQGGWHMPAWDVKVQEPHRAR